jgi:hypothetical protein
MFTRPKTQPFFPTIQTELANRKHLSVVPEVNTPAQRTFLIAPLVEKQRPVSEAITEIFETDEDDSSLFEEDADDFISFQSVSQPNSLVNRALALTSRRERVGTARPPSQHSRKSRRHSPGIERIISITG